ncbi:MAG TPA: 3-phosphoglycerate dehydrogenase [Candidatus Acetothermia bacterium]|nr:3-phosphoglycerate dehydrogenase [Candidatus Acetothermia bacterium]
MTYRVLVSDPLDPKAVAAMREAGLEVEEKTDLSPQDLLEEIVGYDALVIRSATKVRADVLDASSRLKLVVRAGVGLDNVDVHHAAQRGVAVRNTPAASSDSVAELALGHILSLARHIGRGTVSTKAGRWEKKKLKGVEISGKTLGIVGIGRIGQSLARKAHALGMNVICHDKLLQECPVPQFATFVTLPELLQRSDFVSLHIPFDPKFGATIGAAELAQMREGAFVINCARGGVVDETALVEALDSGRLAGVALDVYATEPPDTAHPLFSREAVSLTPHIGASTVEAQERVGEEAAQIVIAFFRELG